MRPAADPERIAGGGGNFPKTKNVDPVLCPVGYLPITSAPGDAVKLLMRWPL